MYNIYKINKKMKFSDVIEILRPSNYDFQDEDANVIICPECEEWTWTHTNLSSFILNLCSDFVVYNICFSNKGIEIWIETASYNVPLLWSDYVININKKEKKET